MFQGMDIDVSEEDQMHQAIAMSLGESTDKTPGPKAKEKVSRVEKVNSIVFISKKIVKTYFEQYNDSLNFK